MRFGRMWLFLFAAALAPPWSRAAEKTPASEIGVDLGQAIAGEPVTCRFVLSNPDDADLFIQSVEACWFADMDPYFGIIPPGAEQTLRARLDTTSLRGRATCPIEIRANDPRHPDLTVLCTVDVRSAFDVAPAPPLYFEVFAGESWSTDVVVTAAAPGDPGLSDARAEGGLVKAELAAEPAYRSDALGRAQVIRISIPGSEEPGRHITRVIAQPVRTDLPCVVIPVYGVVKGDIEVEPPRALFSYAKGSIDSAQPRRVRISSLKGAPMAVRPITGLPSYLAARVDETVPWQQVEITFSLTAVPPGTSFATDVRIELDDPPGRILTVPVSGKEF